MTVATTQAKRLHQKAVVCASTGNTSASLAAYASEAEITGLVLIPKGSVAVGKISQALAYGTKTLVVNGDFDDCMRLIFEAQKKLQAYRSTRSTRSGLKGKRQLFGKRCSSFSGKFQTGLFFPGGNLGNTSAFGKALHEALQLGLIEKMPRIAVIQAEGANPFFKAYKTGFKEFEAAESRDYCNCNQDRESGELHESDQVAAMDERHR